MAVVTTTYSSSTALTMTIASTASSSGFTGGVESTAVSNATDKYVDVLLTGQITVGSTVTANTQILVYVFGQMDDTPTYPDVMDGTDSTETLTSAGVGRGYLRLAASIDVDSTTANRAYTFGPVAIAPLFGGVVPQRWGVFITHNTGSNLNSTGSNHYIKYQGIKYDVT